MLPLVLLVVASIAGVALAGYGFASILRAWRVRAWHEVAAVVVESKVLTVPVLIRQTHTAYYPFVRFRYESATGHGESCNYSVAKNDYRSFDRAQVEEALRQYAPGRTVPAYVSPSNPQQAVLRAQVSRSTMSHFVAVLASGVLVLLACAFLVRHAVP